MGPVNVLEAFDTEFAAWRGKHDWNAWRVFLKALTATPLTPDELPLFEKCTGRTKQFEQPVTEAWLPVGRRARKSAVAAMIGAWAACYVDWAPCLAPGEQGRVIIVAVSREQAKIVRRYCEAILASNPRLGALVTASDQDSITLGTNIVIQVVSNSFRSIRGPSVVAAVFEELAFWRSDKSATPDREVLRAVRPSMLLTRKRGALLIGISSPYARKGLLYERFHAHWGRDDSHVLVWQADTLTMNPEADPEEIDEAYRDDPVAAASEYGAQFRDDLSDFLDADLIASLTRTSPLELPPREGVRYVAFIDPSGGRGDSMTMAVAHQEDGRAVVDALRGVDAPFDPAHVVPAFASLLKEYGVREAVGDAYGAEWVASAFEAEGVTYRRSERNKSTLYLEALPGFTRGQVELPDLRTLAVQLAGLQRRTARGGKDSVDHPPGAHDDYANAVCGALVLAAAPVEDYDNVHIWFDAGAPVDPLAATAQVAPRWHESVNVDSLGWRAVAQ